MAHTIPLDYTGQRESINFSRMVLGDVMGKQCKATKGYSSGVVRDYPNAVEAVAESEGFGSSDRGQAMLAASQDSFAPYRKWISLNVDGYGSSVIPVQLLSLSKMPPMERRDLEAKLKVELEKVRKLQRKVASFSKGAVVHPSTAVHSYQNEPGKKKFPPGKSGPRTKGGSMAARNIESTKQNTPLSTNFVMFMKQCETLLTRLMQHQHAWIFNEPVDIVKHNIPDYFNVIKHPMDLGTVKQKLLSNEYASPVEFAADVRLTFKNAMTYNPPGHDVHVMAEIMRKHFEVRWKSIEKKIPSTADESTASKSSVIVEPEHAYVPPSKKQKTMSGEKRTRNERDKRVMSDDDKQKLGEELEAVLAELPDNIINFLKDSTSNGVVNEDEIEIDIDSLSDGTLFTLQKLLDDYLQEKQRKQIAFQPSEAEVQKEYRFSSISCKDNEPADEDVETGGNDPPPISSSSPINNDKYATRRGSNDSQSSSSESGSSSTDTDSESSASEVEGTKKLEPVTTISGTVDASAEQKETELRVPKCEELGTAEQKSVSNSSSSELNHQGENAHPERQVSPEKLYRAALLRGRFADIIIKAQENTLEKGEKPDTEKLKLEREELERRRREEKARLQAEAKAAEEARIKAAAEAAAEAKRKRELEREAARQALQKMEKTVDLNENSQFMEDLEMFKSGPDEDAQVFIEDASPDNSRSGLGSFNFRANSNPLEQLGLYMKNDEDEDEEVVPEHPMEASHDPEEGEID